MKKPNQNSYALALYLISSLLILLWVYTAASKLANVQVFKQQLNSQVFSKTTVSLLWWLIPGTELLAAGMLLFARSRFAGLCISVFLLFLFSGYIVLVLSGFYERVPCSCGGVLRQLGWKQHLVFNLFFLLLAIAGLWFYVDAKPARKPEHK